MSVRDFAALAKPRVTSLVLVTTAGGMWLSPGALPVWRAGLVLLGTALAVASANTLNCWLERDVDARMARTRNRPLPAGRLSPRAALVFGLVLGLLSVPLLAASANGLTALLGAGAIVSYVGIYTPMKLRSPKALLVGAVPGALPPLLGWTAVSGRLDPAGLVLFAIVFLWQLPHFIAIAIARKEEYAAAGIRVGPVVRGDRLSKIHATLWTAALVPVTMLLVPLGVAGTGYLVVAAILGATFLAWTIAGLRTPRHRAWATGLFRFSLAYLTLLFVALGVFAVR
ncbi:MAG: protoheme IX farnesyltransferase [Deltaproteobacteria bacterium]|nr:protoheme IX farnesyltransferase [Deltaproteobacteria bacterium]